MREQCTYPIVYTSSNASDPFPCVAFPFMEIPGSDTHTKVLKSYKPLIFLGFKLDHSTAGKLKTKQR